MVTGEPMPVSKADGRASDRRHRQPERRADRARRQDRPRYHAGADRRHGGAGAALAGADPASRRSGRRLVRAGGDRRGIAGVRGLDDVRAGAALYLRPGRGGDGADHRLSLRAGAGHADVDHGRHRPRRAFGNPDPRRRRRWSSSSASTPSCSTRPAPSPKASRKWSVIIPADGFEESELLRLAASVERGSEHPLARAILRAASDRKLMLGEVRRFCRRLPARARPATVDGKAVALGNALLMRERNVATARSGQRRGDGPAGWRHRHLRVGAMAAPPESSPSPIRSSRRRGSALQALRQDGLRIVMLTGDNPTTARAVAKTLGIDEVEAGVLPERKSEVVQRLAP